MVPKVFFINYPKYISGNTSPPSIYILMNRYFHTSKIISSILYLQFIKKIQLLLCPYTKYISTCKNCNYILYPNYSWFDVNSYITCFKNKQTKNAVSSRTYIPVLVMRRYIKDCRCYHTHVLTAQGFPIQL